MRMRGGSKAQVWSIDLVIGLLVFALVGVILYSLIAGSNDESKISKYSEKAEALTNNLYRAGLVDPNSGEFNDAIYLELSQEDYEVLKTKLGVKGDFCLFVETTDTPPKLLVIHNKTGIGSSDFSIGGVKCGVEVNST